MQRARTAAAVLISGDEIGKCDIRSSCRKHKVVYTMLYGFKKAFYYKAGVHWLSCAAGQRVAGTWFRLGGELRIHVARTKSGVRETPSRRSREEIR